MKRTLQSDEPMPVARTTVSSSMKRIAAIFSIKSRRRRTAVPQPTGLRFCLPSYSDHFDAVKIALTATPALHTVQFSASRFTVIPTVPRLSTVFYRPRSADSNHHPQRPGRGLSSKGEQVERISPQGEVINDTLKTIRILRSPTLTVAW